MRRPTDVEIAGSVWPPMSCFYAASGTACSSRGAAVLSPLSKGRTAVAEYSLPLTAQSDTQDPFCVGSGIAVPRPLPCSTLQRVVPGNLCTQVLWWRTTRRTLLGRPALPVKVSRPCGRASIPSAVTEPAPLVGPDPLHGRPLGKRPYTDSLQRRIQAEIARSGQMVRSVRGAAHTMSP